MQEIVDPLVFGWYQNITAVNIQWKNLGIVVI